MNKPFTSYLSLFFYSRNEGIWIGTGDAVKTCTPQESCSSPHIYIQSIHSSDSKLPCCPRWDFGNNDHKVQVHHHEWSPWCAKHLALQIRRKPPQLGPVPVALAYCLVWMLPSCPQCLWDKVGDPTEGCITLLLPQNLGLTQVWQTPNQDLFTAQVWSSKWQQPVNWSPEAVRPSDAGSSRRKQCTSLDGNSNHFISQIIFQPSMRCCMSCLHWTLSSLIIQLSILN